MRTSTYYDLKIYEGSDVVNPLVVDAPNIEAIDEIMHDNATESIGTATELLSGSVHAITRDNPDAAMFRFTATANWTAGDTMTVDGIQVTVLLPSGEALGSGAYVINSNVLACLNGTLVTVYTAGGIATVAQDAEKLGGQLPSYYGTADDVAGAISVAQAASTVAQAAQTAVGLLDTRIDALEDPVINVGVEEQIGMLGDKPLYRKVYQATGVNINSIINLDTALNFNTIEPIKYEGTFKYNADSSYRMIGQFGNSYVYPILFTDALKLSVNAFTVNAYTITVTYTKK